MKKEKKEISAWTAFGGLFLLLGIIMMIGWGSRGFQIRDFTGEGQAEILSIREGIGADEDYFRYTARLQIEGETSTVSGRRRSGGWKEGMVLPAVYSVKDHTVYVIGSTPEDYRRWIRNSGFLTGFLLFTGMGCILRGMRRKKKNKEEKYLDGPGKEQASEH